MRQGETDARFIEIGVVLVTGEERSRGRWWVKLRLRRNWGVSKAGTGACPTMRATSEATTLVVVVVVTLVSTWAWVEEERGAQEEAEDELAGSTAFSWDDTLLLSEPFEERRLMRRGRTRSPSLLRLRRVKVSAEGREAAICVISIGSEVLYW